MSTIRKYELTSGQLLIWLGMQRHPDVPIYNMAMTVRIASAVDTQLFSTAFNQVVAESDALCSVFTNHDGLPVRRIRTESANEIELLDLSGHTTPQRNYVKWLNERSQRMLDVASRTFDAVLIKLADDDFAWYLNLHHLITDAWSSRLVYERVAEVYRHLKNGEETTGEALPGFQTLVEELATAAHSPRHQAAIDYWQERATALDALEPLEIYRRGVATGTTACDRCTVNLDANQIAEIEALTHEKALRSLNRDVTLFQVFTTVLFALLYRVSGQHMLVIGAPALNRTTATQRKTIGLLMEMLALQATIEPQESLASLYKKVQADTVSFFRHSRPGVSNAKLLKKSSVLLNFVRGAFPPFDETPVAADYVHAGHAEPHNALRLQVRDLAGSGELAIDFDFNCEVFDATARSAFIAQFLSMLEAFTRHREQPVTNLDLLSDNDKSQLLAFNDTATAYISDQALHEQFSFRVRQVPKQAAVRDDTRSLTYRELDQHSNRLAHWLIEHGVNPGDRVALIADRSVLFIVGVLATMKAGAAYLPIDNSLPQKRRRLLLEQGQPAVTLATNDWPDYDACSDQQPNIRADVDDLAYVLFTSGSTGKPKGVECNHRGVVNLLEDIESRQPLPAGAHYSLWTSIGFDVSVYEIFAALTNGGTLHMVPEAIRADTRRLFDWLCAKRINSAYLPPFMLHEITSICETQPGALMLQRLLVGVEPILQSTLTKLRRANPGLCIINGYGPTETTICATLYTVPGQSYGERRTPIGQPVNNNRLYVLDDFGQPVPPGVPGELYIGGDGLARGYLDQPQLTRQRFVRDPFDEQPEARLFRTGDLVRYLPEGALEFIGRVDHQLKIQGHRVEPGEIERELQKHPQVQEAVVLTRDVDGNKTLVAYLLTTDDLSLAPSDWFARLHPVLPGYMIPSAYVTLDAFPLTASGKIDRAALPTPQSQRPEPAAGSDEPTTPIEQTLAEIWAQILAIETIGVHDHFIDLGGESIQALQIVARAHDQGIVFTPRDLFECATIARLAQRAITGSKLCMQPSDNEQVTGNELRAAAAKAGLSADDLDDLLAEYGED